MTDHLETSTARRPAKRLLRLVKSAAFISAGVYASCSALLFFLQARMLVPPFGAERVDQTIATARPTGLAAPGSKRE